MLQTDDSVIICLQHPLRPSNFLDFPPNCEVVHCFFMTRLLYNTESSIFGLRGDPARRKARSLHYLS